MKTRSLSVTFIIFAVTFCNLHAQLAVPPKPPAPAVTSVQIAGKYRQTDKTPLLTTDFLWDFHQDGTVDRIGTSTFGPAIKDPIQKNHGKYQINGRSITAMLDGINLKFVFDILENGDLIPNASMGYVKAIQMKKQPPAKASSAYPPRSATASSRFLKD